MKSASTANSGTDDSAVADKEYPGIAGIAQALGNQSGMNAAATVYDNAFMESCYGTVKTELELVYANDPEAVRELSAYVRYYNTSRRHSVLGYVSPAEFENQPTLPK